MLSKNINKVAIIPARYGSKRIKKKNIKKFYSKPMITWVISKLIKSKIFDKIVVSSDSKKILDISRKCGANILINRPANLSDDKITTVPVIRHAINELKLNYNYSPEYICCVYPCNPFLVVQDLIKSLNLIKKNKSKFVFPITEYSHPIQRALKIGKFNNLTSFFNKNSLKRTQDLEKTFHDVGQFYWGTRKQWTKNDNIHAKSIGIVIPNWRVVDIDNISDWKKAESLFKLLNK